MRLNSRLSRKSPIKPGLIGDRSDGRESFLGIFAAHVILEKVREILLRLELHVAQANTVEKHFEFEFGSHLMD